MTTCARCRTAFSRDEQVCPTCGLRAGVLPSNEATLKAAGPRLRRPSRAGPIRLAIVAAFAALVAGANVVAPDRVGPVVQTTENVVGQTLQLVGQAAENALARRSRTPAPGR